MKVKTRNQLKFILSGINANLTIIIAHPKLKVTERAALLTINNLIKEVLKKW